MGGKRLGSFRSGDRSEYLAVYSLSRIAFVNPFPRQEDFGVADFLCVLTKQEGTYLYPESAFYVQVKSTEDKVVFDEEAVRWISDHMNHPLFLCVVNKSDNLLKIHSCWQIWRALLLRRYPKELTLIPNTALPLNAPDLQDQSFDVSLGPPIISKSVDEFEKEPGEIYRVMRDWLIMDVLNIARKHVARIAAAGFTQWTTNVPPTAENRFLQNCYFFGPNYPYAEKELALMLTALAHNYKANQEGEKLEAVSALLAHLREYLDSQGLDFANTTSKD